VALQPVSATSAKTVGNGICTTRSRVRQLGDQDAIEYMCRQGCPTVIELEHAGMPFSVLTTEKSIRTVRWS
jgi:hypothetical protein